MPECRFTLRRLRTICVVLATCARISLEPGAAEELRPAQAEAAFFPTRIEPILREHCFECHSHAAGKMKAGLTLDSRSGWEQGGEHGPAIIPGDPDQSRLIQAVRRGNPETAMPPKSALAPEQVALLESWVRQGASDPRVPTNNVAGAGSAEAWWALESLLKPSIPRGRQVHPVDAFVETWMQDHGQTTGLRAPADRRTLLRRLTVDLHGLLPMAEEVAAFEADPAPDAWERRVEQALASPRYGERWARHWLDIVHFAETHGHDQDRPRDHAWPYRDYVIESFNEDKPFQVFAGEQIAADALFPDHPERTPALGFLAAGPWDESSLRDIREDTVDREIGRYLDRDDIVANVMSTFSGVTAHCARCHDHKFDPITQKDYYALQAVFAATEKAERVYDLDSETNQRRQYWMGLQVALDRRDHDLLDRWLTPELRRDLAEWELRTKDRPISWEPLVVERIAGRQGTVYQPRPDDSWFASGASPATEITEVIGRPKHPRPTAFRLEVLPDESLPSKGPGRAENGNLHLTEFRVFTLASTNGSPPVESRVALQNATSDFDQDAWDVTKAIDGQPATAWGIHPQEGKAHQAVFEIGTPLATEERNVRPVLFRLQIEQEHGRQHTIGRFRVSTTTNAAPVRASGWPAEMAAALAVPPDARTPEQRFRVASAYLPGRVARELRSLPEPKRVFAGASLFLPNANQKPLGHPRPIRRLRRGEINQPQEEAIPGALGCVTVLPDRFGADPVESHRRANLAVWLTHPDNPFFWRVIANRVWQYHFGRGIVETPNDFGRMGSPPSDPNLLDFLAASLRDDFAGSLKQLHRLVLTSRAWQQPAADPLHSGPLQPIRRRLDAETFRDATLQLNGRLDLAMFGPSARQFVMTDGIHVTPNVDYASQDLAAPGNYRRSIYRFLFRTLPDPLMDALDSPSGDQSTPARPESFTALQAFALLNHPFIVRQAGTWADRLEARSADLPSQIRLAFADAFQRAPAAAELAACAEYARTHGLSHFCRMLWNSNEFHFLE